MTADLRRVYVLFFASGFAGLVYEVSWVRQLGNVFGNTLASASLVTAVFMCGLGVGSHRAGVYADAPMRRGDVGALLRSYAIVEAAIGVFGLMLAFVLPRLGVLAASFSSYARGADGWYAASIGTQIVRWALAIVLVGPPSLLMGATLTLLVRATIVRPEDAGFRIALLYGINTGGAALGALACDAWLVPALGIFETQGLAAAVNVTVAVLAMVVARRRRTSIAEPIAEAAPASSEPPAASASPSLAAACLALAFTGFSSLGMEIVWFRFLSAILGGYRFVFSLILALILVGIWVGAMAAGIVQRRMRSPARTFVVAQAVLVVTALATLATASPTPQTTYANALVSVARVVLVPAIAMGASFPLVNAWLHDTGAKVGRRTGALYLANTLGSVMGSLVAGFVLAPRIGSVASFGVFAFAAALAPLFVALGPKATPDANRDRRAALVAVALAVPVFGVWFSLPANLVASRYVPLLKGGHPILTVNEGPHEMLMVVERAKDHRVLVTNGHPMSGTSLAGQRYMRAFAHLPLLMTPEAKNALVVCFGVGSTLHATSLHPLERIDLVDVSRNVLEHASWFEATNHDVLKDPRVSVFVEDGRQHLRQTPSGTYDLVTMEPPPIGFAGIASLYSAELYALARSRLAPNGMMTQWLPAYDVPPDVGLAMVRAFVDVFPHSALLSGWGPELILLGINGDSLELDLDRVEAALRARPNVAADLSRVHLGTLRDIAGTFVADAEDLAPALAPVPPITDDRPRMEYTFADPASLSVRLFEHSSIRRFCPKCFDGDVAAARVDGLVEHLAILGRVYRDPRFLRNELPYKTKLAGAREASVVQTSAYLAEFVAGPPKSREDDPRAIFVRAFDLAMQRQLEASALAYARGLALAPNDVDAHYNYAVVLASSGRQADAVTEAKKTLALAPSHPKAKAMLCTLSPPDCPAP